MAREIRITADWSMAFIIVVHNLMTLACGIESCSAARRKASEPKSRAPEEIFEGDEESCGYASILRKKCLPEALYTRSQCLTKLHVRNPV